MPFRRKEHLVGVDIGSSIVKATALTSLKKGRMLKQYGQLELPAGTIAQGAVADAANLTDTLSELFQRFDFKTRQVALALSSQAVIRETITLDKTAEDYLYERVLLESEHHIPYGLEEVNIDFHVIGDHPVNPQLMEILVVAAKKETVSAYLAAAGAANLKVRIVDVDAFALQNCFDYNDQKPPGVTALINVGAQNTLFTVVHGNISHFSRHLMIGCRQIDRGIAHQVGCSETEARRIKFGDSARGIGTDAFYRVELDITSQWCTEIHDSIDLYNDTYPAQPIDHIMLSGGGANVAVFQQQLALKTGMEANLLDPFDPIALDTQRFETGYIRGVAPLAAISVGLALREVSDK